MSGVDPGLIRAWLAARSVARGLPAPVADHGGWRVDSGQPRERRRYVFAEPCEGLRELGATIDEPWVALKLCCSADELFALLPPRWQPTEDIGTRVLVRDHAPAHPAELPPGYRLMLATTGPIRHVRILAGEEEAAGGYAAESDGVFVYDRIVTAEAHRRRGLARVVMAMLAGTRRSPTSQEILTATPVGRALYRSIGWRDYSHYATAMIPPGGT